VSLLCFLFPGSRGASSPSLFLDLHLFPFFRRQRLLRAERFFLPPGPDSRLPWPFCLRPLTSEREDCPSFSLSSSSLFCFSFSWPRWSSSLRKPPSFRQKWAFLHWCPPSLFPTNLIVPRLSFPFSPPKLLPSPRPIFFFIESELRPPFAREASFDAHRNQTGASFVPQWRRAPFSLPPSLESFLFLRVVEGFSFSRQAFPLLFPLVYLQFCFFIQGSFPHLSCFFSFFREAKIISLFLSRPP